MHGEKGNVAIDVDAGDAQSNEPNETTYKALADSESGNDMHGPFDNVKDLMEALDA